MSHDSPAAILYDEEGNPVAISTGNIVSINVADKGAQETLCGIHDELKKISFLLGLIVDINPEDL